MVAHQICGWANFSPESAVVFSVSCVAATGPKAVIAIAGTDNVTWHHNFKFQPKLLCHQQRCQHSHLVDTGVFHQRLRISLKAFSSSTPGCAAVFTTPGSRAPKKPYRKANRATSAFLNPWPAAEGDAHRSPVSSQVVFSSWVSWLKESLDSLLVSVSA